ncbi:thioredoxin domain-containing protein [SAR202 cluster bacterium AC-647-N09_OGT_505m]|nr:thioredoxin domain-containing protein [SAR202 cluster bacterium AC-647-N09_OGT_505m]
MSNRLINETSPYLVQHANNPVDWYPWGEEALQRARVEDKPIFLSIGYSACHWCHVMERESFEDPNIAQLMNQSFINIKVDREERPDLDSIYMLAVQAMTGRGGWPLSIFLTPEIAPFYGGTYFPPQGHHGMPGFIQVLGAVAEAYRTRRDDIEHSVERITTAIMGATRPVPITEPLTADILSTAYEGLKGDFDPENGGFGTAPKFPQPMILEFLLRFHHRTRDPQALSMVETTLNHMARGGIYDHLGGGFHRYSTDPSWLVPHFEKMLYDNALLSRLYLHAYQATGNPSYGSIAQETLDYVLREMKDPQGGFYSAQDADSEGEEGKSFVWTPNEIEKVLGPHEASVLQRYFGVTHEGNFEGQNILSRSQDIAEIAYDLNLEPGEMLAIVERGKAALLKARSRRVSPATDTKVLASWNGLMLYSLARGAAILHREDYLQAAIANASFILQNMRHGQRLLRTYTDGQAKLKGYLEDYAFLVDGLLALYEATFDFYWLKEAQTLAQHMMDLFWDEGEGVFYDTGLDHEALLIRPRDIGDNAMPCGGSMASDVLLRLSVFTGDSIYAKRAASAFKSVQGFMGRAPQAVGHWLGALDFYFSSPQEIAVIGPREDEATKALLECIYGSYLPNKVLAGYNPLDANSHSDIPLLEDKDMRDGTPTVFVCQNYVCQQPVTEPGALAQQLTGQGPATSIPFGLSQLP